MMQNETILGKFELGDVLKENALWVDFQGKDIESGQEILASAISLEFTSAADFLTRFGQIAEKFEGLDTPYCAALLDFGEHEGQAVVIQELIEGQTLAAMLVDSDGLPENLVLDITQQVGKYLQTLHQADLVHGCLDLENIMLSSKGIVCVRDAGLAQGLDVSHLISNGKIDVTPLHAPELRTGGTLTPATDFYALGAVLFKLLTGDSLELEPTDLWPGNKKSGLLPEIDELVFKCLQSDSTRRIQSAAELINGVEEARRGSQAGAQDTILGMEDVLVGHTLGAYQLVERLGQGGMATVYKAYEPALDRYVAIKVLPQFFARDPNFMNRFRREAKAVAQLNHPSIMPIYSFGEEGEITYIAMQYVPGGTLKQGRGHVYEPTDAIRLALPIVRALAYAHGRGIVHRDIKPSNVLLGEDDWPVLADFGLAKMAEASQQLTGTGVGVGTPMYMSPEQGQGTGVDHRTDIYSTGIMLYEMLTGDVPFRADTPMAVVIKHMTAPLPMPREANPDIPEALELVILKATAKSSDDRFQTAEEMIEALEKVQNSLLAPAQDVDQAEVTAPALKEPAVLVRDADPTPLAKTIKKAGIYLGGVIGVLLIGLILMWVFDICPPEGPWPIPPWCPGTTYNLPTIGGGEEESSANITEGTLGSVIFQDDFDDGISSRWQFTASEYLVPWGVEKSAGRTFMRTTSPTRSGEMNSAEIRDTNWENYAVEIDFRFDQPDQFGEYYFWIRGRLTDCPPTVQALQAYSVQLTLTGTQIIRSDCSGGADETVGTNGIGLEVGVWYTLRMVFVGSRMQVYIDDQHLIDYIDEDPLSGGDLWIETMGNSQILFDNLKVYEVIPGEVGIQETVSTDELCSPGETLLLYENFEDGSAWNWEFSDSNGNPTDPWSIVTDEKENHVLAGSGHNWATYPQINQEDLTMSLRYRKGSMGSAPYHINFRVGEEGRYYLSSTALMKDPNDLVLAQFDANLEDTEWHDLRITVIGNQIQVFVDDQLVVDYQDDDPLGAGIVGIENTDQDNIWYDDIVVCGVPAETDASVPDGDSASQGSEAVIATKIYQDGFDGDTFDEIWHKGNLENWRIEDGDNERAIIGTGSMRFGDEDYVVSNFQFDIDFNLKKADSQGYYGALFGFRSGDCSGYLLELFDEGGGLIKTPCSGEATNYNFTYPEALNPGEWHHLQVRMVGNHIRVLVEDQLMLDVVDDGELIDSGKFAFWAQDSQAITYFDNFSLQELTDASEIEFFVDSGLRIGDQYTRSLAVGDVDADGDFDIAAANSGQANVVWNNTGDNLFLKGFEGTTTDDHHSIFMGDYDGNGTSDLFITNWQGPSYIVANDGNGNFEHADNLESEFGVSQGFGSDSGDLDGDGDLDIWLAVGDDNFVWFNDGMGGFTVSETTYPGGDSVGVALGDLDGDGDLDAFIANYIGRVNAVFLNQGNGVFSDSGQKLGDSPSQEVVLGDLDGDGDLDAFVANLEDQPNTVWMNNGSGAFVDTGQQLGQHTSRGVALGDLDNDGDLDAYVVNGYLFDNVDDPQPQPNEFYLNDGSGNFAAISHPANLTLSMDAVLVDMNGDGWLDVVEGTTETILIHLSQGFDGLPDS